MTNRLPDFFILGAPKCGTTSLASWLGKHENIYMSPEKEPNYFNTDVRIVGRISDREYQALFRGAREKHIVVGEATTGYLRSQVAVQRILDRVGDARFISCIRNPIEMAVSFHAELVKSGIETEVDFENAWRLQESRQQGDHIPRFCFHREDLLYGQVCRLGAQIERVINRVGRDRLLVIVLDDMQADPRNEYLRALEFFGVPDDGRTEFPIQNKALSLPLLLAQALRAGSLMKRKLGIRGQTGTITAVREILGKSGSKQKLTPAFRQELIEYFRADIEKLAAILNRDFKAWLSVQGVA